jgi:hypothetical protein
MKIRFAAALVLTLAFTAALPAQDPAGQDQAGQGSGAAAPSAGQGSNTSSGQNSTGSSDGQGQGGGYGRRSGRGGFGGGMGMRRGPSGTVTEAAADHFTVKTFEGDTYTVRFSADTRMLKQAAGMRGASGQGNGGQGNGGQGDAAGRGQGFGQGGGRGFGGNPPEPIKAADIKVGDAIDAMGDVDATAKTVSATTIVLMDPERARQMQEMAANYGKTWLMGKVTAIDGVKVTLNGTMDNAAHSFVADENTTFRRRRDPITLADIQVGDAVRADGAVKDGVFTAASVGDMGSMQGGPARVPGNGQPPTPQP